MREERPGSSEEQGILTLALGRLPQLYQLFPRAGGRQPNAPPYPAPPLSSKGLWSFWFYLKVHSNATFYSRIYSGLFLFLFFERERGRDRGRERDLSISCLPPVALTGIKPGTLLSVGPCSIH